MTTLCFLPDMSIRSGEQKHFCLLLFERPLALGYSVCVEQRRGMWVSGWRLSEANSQPLSVTSLLSGKAVSMRNVCLYHDGPVAAFRMTVLHLMTLCHRKLML
jgi:hypothetical protein